MKKNSHIIEEINGFNINEIYSLYKFVCIWENTLYKMKNGHDLVSKYPKLKGFINKINKTLSPKCTSKKVISQMQDNEIIPGIFYYASTNNRKKEITVLLRLRNAIAHGIIKKQGDYITIEDFDNNKNLFSAKGRIKYNQIFDIINLLNNIITL